MSPVTPSQRKNAIRGVATRLKFPQLFVVMAVLFVLDLAAPDLIPFIDEILLGLGTVLFGMWRERVEPAEEPSRAERPMKDITPEDQAE